MESFEGDVQRVLFSNDTGFTIALIKPHGGGAAVKVTGEYAVAIGDTIAVSGEWTSHPKFGKQFKATAVTHQIGDGDHGMVLFLRHLPGLGETRARLLVKTLGGRAAVEDAIENDPARLAETPGVTPEMAEEIARAYKEKVGVAAALVFLTGECGLGDRLAVSIIDELGASVHKIVREDPYRLMEVNGVGFLKADEVALRIGVSRSDVRRLRAAAVFALELQEDEGHTVSSLDDLLSKDFNKRCGVPRDELLAGLESARAAKRGLAVHATDDGRWMLRRTYDAEVVLAEFFS